MTIVDKEYGKLTENQFKRLIRKSKEFRQESKQLQEVLRTASKEKLRELLGDGVWWAPVYELSLVQGIAFLVYVLGETDRIKAVAQLTG
ncbi:MAG TPA: hypothetical protein VHE58_00620 [Burkholderiales bacterium]|nr:hypothetical protein [Burkholderiales bacterium]